MVVHDPGDWFEETLASVAAQQYANCALLVIDTGTRDDTVDRIAQVVPDAHYRRVDADVGFGRAVNEAQRAVQGAAFYLIEPTSQEQRPRRRRRSATRRGTS